MKELESLIDIGEWNPTLPQGHPFTDVENNDYYWTSATYVFIPANAWVIRMSDGYIRGLAKTGDHYVWPVRDAE